MASIVDKHGNVAYFGRLSWGNLLDWCVTLCLGAIFILMTSKLGGVRPDTHLVLLPLFALLLSLHGVWLAVDKESPKRLSQVPFWFLPALLWIVASAAWFSPVPWRGWLEVVYILELFIVLWVLANNLRTRAHLWSLIVMSLVPSAPAIFNGFFQFFQRPDRMVDAMTPFGLELSPEFLGRATGSFADPNSFAAYLIILLPTLLIAAAVPRLPRILRILSFYLALIFLFAVLFTQAYWASFLSVVVVALVPWFCFRKLSRRLWYSILSVVIASVVFFGMFFLHPVFEKGLAHAASPAGEGIRFVLWEEAGAMLLESPLLGVGAGAFQQTFEQSTRVAWGDSPLTPHNDYMLMLSQYGIIGFLLIGLPFAYVVWRAYTVWRKEPFAVKLRDSKGTIMTPQRFFLSLGLAGFAAFALSSSLTFVIYVPALSLFGLLLFSILLKASSGRHIRLPESLPLRCSYLLLAVCSGWSFWAFASIKLESSALQLRAVEELEHVVEMRVHLSGNKNLLDQVIVRFEDALIADSMNADAWIGHSAAVCQLYFRNPSGFAQYAERAAESAQRAVDLSPGYWSAWTQLGVARSFQGESLQAEQDFKRALELAPNSSNALYYYAAYLSAFPARRAEALATVVRSLEINPDNPAARRLEQKLLIL